MLLIVGFGIGRSDLSQLRATSGRPRCLNQDSGEIDWTRGVVRSQSGVHRKVSHSLLEAALNVSNVLFAANQEELLNSFAGFDLTRKEIPSGIRH